MEPNNFSLAIITRTGIACTSAAVMAQLTARCHAVFPKGTGSRLRHPLAAPRSARLSPCCYFRGRAAYAAAQLPRERRESCHQSAAGERALVSERGSCDCGPGVRLFAGRLRQGELLRHPWPVSPVVARCVHGPCFAALAERMQLVFLAHTDAGGLLQACGRW